MCLYEEGLVQRVCGRLLVWMRERQRDGGMKHHHTLLTHAHAHSFTRDLATPDWPVSVWFLREDGVRDTHR